ncbi:MAG TPA: MBL fold metallo-hydrolase [Caulobacterales bacterium]|nr:MBL fold metallo-hydrolase [Caulobacterales bacterium]
MAAPVPFVREMDFAYGEVQRVSPLIRRVVANNPGPFTFRGTGVYIVGAGVVAIIDPGPDLPDHIETLRRAIADERVAAILVTHRHLDHSPAARPLAQATGAAIHASGIAPRVSLDDFVAEAGDDLGFAPDVAIGDGATISGPGWTLEAIATPGHTSDHLCFALREENALFSGDHIMGWSTTVISPPDGDMDDYLTSLDKVRERAFATLWPTHGPPVRNVASFIDAYKAHRLDREAQILAQLAMGKARIMEMVPAIYADVDQRLHPAAAHSVLAHLIRLAKLGRVTCHGAPGIGSDYALA